MEQKELTCSVQAGNPAPTVTWQHQIDTCESSSTDKCEPLDNAWSVVDEVCVCLFNSLKSRSFFLLLAYTVFQLFENVNEVDSPLPWFFNLF